jgi:hypothetical protein
LTALAICVLGFVAGWYALVLISAPPGSFGVDGRQWTGLGFAVVLGVISWAYKCYTVY